MLPLYDTIPSRQRPVVNWVLIAINVMIFFFIEVPLSSDALTLLFNLYGVVPRRFTDPQWAYYMGLSPDGYWVFLTSMFLHGSFMHLLSNMWTLWIFGDNVEDRMGSLRYLIFYLLCGILAGITHFLLYQTSDKPAIGASGAISGVMGAYMFLFPRSRIVFLIPLFFVPYFVALPAFLYIGAWFIGQFFSGTVSLAVNPEGAGIAFWAHIGGFLAGVLLFKLFLRPSWRPPYPDEYGQRWTPFY